MGGGREQQSCSESGSVDPPPPHCSQHTDTDVGHTHMHTCTCIHTLLKSLCPCISGLCFQILKKRWDCITQSSDFCKIQDGLSLGLPGQLPPPTDKAIRTLEDKWPAQGHWVFAWSTSMCPVSPAPVPLPSRTVSQTHREKDIAKGSWFVLALLEEDFLKITSGFMFDLFLKMKSQVFNPPMCKLLVSGRSLVIVVPWCSTDEVLDKKEAWLWTAGVLLTTALLSFSYLWSAMEQ